MKVAAKIILWFLSVTSAFLPLWVIVSVVVGDILGLGSKGAAAAQDGLGYFIVLILLSIILPIFLLVVALLSRFLIKRAAISDKQSRYITYLCRTSYLSLLVNWMLLFVVVM